MSNENEIETVTTYTVAALAEKLLRLANDAPDIPVMVADADGNFHGLHDAGFVSVETIKDQRPMLMVLLCQTGSASTTQLNMLGTANEGLPN